MDAQFYNALQAWTSLGTAICTFLSLVALAVYTIITRNTFREAHLANEESLRPVLILFGTKQDGGRKVVVYRHTGKGLALNIERAGVEGSADSNVLAPDQELHLDITDTPDVKVIELHYSGLNGKKFITISGLRRDGRVLNWYVPDASKISAAGIKTLRDRLEKDAVLGDVLDTTGEISGTRLLQR